MTNTFLNRVTAERRVLAVVNARLPRNCQLTGLSSAAITHWITVVGLEKTSAIYSVLIDLAKHCQRLSDRSNETFMPVEKENSAKIESQLAILKQELDRLHMKAN